MSTGNNKHLAIYKLKNNLYYLLLFVLFKKILN